MVSSVGAACSFPLDLSERQCIGLDPYSGAADAASCAAACCHNMSCEVWQWCGLGQRRRRSCAAWPALAGHCFLGKPSSCRSNSAGPASRGWVSRGRETARSAAAATEVREDPRMLHLSPSQYALAVVHDGLAHDGLRRFVRRLSSGLPVVSAVIGGVRA